MTPRSSQACCSAGGRNAPDERNSRKWPPSCAWTLRKSSRRIANGRRRAMRSEPVDRRRPAALRDLALDGAPEQVEDLRDDDHGGDAVVAQRIEDDPRVPAPDVEHVGADVERVVQPDGLLEQVGQRQQRDEPVLHRRDDPVERLDRGDDVVVRQHHALRRAGRAAREDELEDLVRRRALPGAWRASQSGGNSGSSAAGSAAAHRRSSSGSRPGRPPPDRGRRGPSRGSGAARPTPGRSSSTASVDIRRSSGTITSRACIAPK